MDSDDTDESLLENPFEVIHAVDEDPGRWERTQDPIPEDRESPVPKRSYKPSRYDEDKLKTLQYDPNTVTASRHPFVIDRGL